MKSELYIKYKEKNESNSTINLSILGESIIGFDKLIKEIIRASSIEGNIDVKVANAREGSIIISILIELSQDAKFQNIEDFRNMLEIIGLNGLDIFKSAGENLNEYLSQNPIQSWGLGKLIEELLKWINKQRKKISIEDNNGKKINKKVAIKLFNIVKANKFKKPLKPLIEDEVEYIDISENPKFSNSIRINSKNLGNFLTDDEKILPEWINGKEIQIEGQIIELHADTQEYIKFKALNIEKKYRLLVAFLLDGTSTEDFIQYFKKDVIIKAEVVRKSMYQKPKLLIKDIAFSKVPLID